MSRNASSWARMATNKNMLLRSFLALASSSIFGGLSSSRGRRGPRTGANGLPGLDAGFHADRFGVALVGVRGEHPGLLLVGAVDAIEPGKRERSFDRRRAREDRTLQRVWEIIEPYRTPACGSLAPSIRRTVSGATSAAWACPCGWSTLTTPIQTAAFTSIRARRLDGSSVGAIRF